MGAIWGMRRAVALGPRLRRAAARVRRARWRDKPLHVDTLAAMAAEQEAAFHLAFFAASCSAGSRAARPAPTTSKLLRILTPIAKLTTGKQAVAVASEVLECFGGAGYVEDTGLPRILADAQVLPIWEGTTNVLSLDTAPRAGHRGHASRCWPDEIGRRVAGARDDSLVACGRVATGAVAAGRRAGWPGRWAERDQRRGRRAPLRHDPGPEPRALAHGRPRPVVPGPGPGPRPARRRRRAPLRRPRGGSSWARPMARSPQPTQPSWPGERRAARGAPWLTAPATGRAGSCTWCATVSTARWTASVAAC